MLVKYFLLGLIQGLTEFFPVSSSAHLVIIQKLLGVGGSGLALSVALHLGTLCAVFVFFHRQIRELFLNKRALMFIGVVTVITAAIGLTGRDLFALFFNSPRLAAAALLVTGIILIFTSRAAVSRRSKPGLIDSLWLGFAQGLAIVPGISRSGITISALMLRGIDKQAALAFSFIASIPAVAGAAVLEAKDINSVCHLNNGYVAVGFLSSLFSGIAALWLLKRILRKTGLQHFGYYCIIFSIVTLFILSG